MTSSVLDVDVIVVGAGPAGATAALFLARAGIRTLMISRHFHTADTPRAHITNQRAMEVLRDAGLEAECMRRASPSEDIARVFWLGSMVGEEYARVWSWGNDPARAGEYALASPCRMSDLPQTELEPVLVEAAMHAGAIVRFGWELEDFTQNEEGVTASIRDRATDAAITVNSRYMVGADGARSMVVEKLGLPLLGQAGASRVFNVLFDADLDAHVAHRKGSLYSVIQPNSAYWAPVAVLRMVKPWKQWLAILIVPDAVGKPDPTPEDFAERIRESIGDPTVIISNIRVSTWTVNEVVAERYREGRVLCVGDAVHRHPPTGGLGSNTCIQDAFNLAWKLAYVLQGKAGAGLLDSFDAERQPVGAQIVARANANFVHNTVLWDLLGAGTRSTADGSAGRTLLETREGRETFRQTIDAFENEYHAHGIEMTRAYASDAVLADTPPATQPEGVDPALYHLVTTTPGHILPHAWLTRRAPSAPVSTLDLAGHDGFALFTGPGGDAWSTAARAVANKLDLPIAAHAIGPHLDWEDPYGRWAKVREIAEDGCILVRPDLVICWRRMTMPDDAEADLMHAISRVLDRSE